ncbi:hypothetical protein [Rhizobium wuzhouense]|uniref:Uncharacterized protein n=1 Tax=Rhizobium wuzhouense TaxID=1986026 RepID=A0ABX5NPM0_9HYPH|nr:hypothetical protein [Rhizobium wuzhouense]PYB71697.1 hypothetical protein DMY87_15905 [Rhizobium wuzhouense]
MNGHFKTSAAFCLIAITSLGLDAPPEAVPPSICGCRAPLASTAILREVTGKVFVSQAEGMRPARADMEVSLPGRLLTGPSSATILKIGDTCTLSVSEKQLIRIEDEHGSWCVRAEAARAAGPTQPAPQSPVPISVLSVLAGGKVMISIARKDERVSR